MQGLKGGKRALYRQINRDLFPGFFLRFNRRLIGPGFRVYWFKYKAADSIGGRQNRHFRIMKNTTRKKFALAYARDNTFIKPYIIK